MPPQVLSESESDGDLIPARNSRKAMPVDNDDIEDDVVEEQDDEEDAADEDGEEFIVEAIKDHKFEGKKLYLHVKWKGYEKKSDMTWEPEENCEGAKEILQEYYEKIGGRPMYRAISIPKRGRQPAGGASAPVSAAPKNTKRARTSFGASSSKSNGDDASPAPVELTTKKNWDEDATIDTIEKTSKGLVCYVHWADGKKTQHPIQDVYNKCPQKMLSFYEQHLVFKESGTL
ncbi:hypothetical protein P167DRAFT_480539 [Morchella conica CCBAS932]|uniref:Chromo domain-containing protein n=1 Tax=Morchella conica CCBAS932 TaxID=1392247 RepID=A0A3N4L1Z2_9PEZI|nr:hypothetical protein P167DRAFT_480539 [Morchella conica CCBAS932]